MKSIKSRGVNMSKHSIGKTIASLRKSRGWTQVELAEKLGISDKTISKWESEAGMPEISQLPALSKLFDVSIDYLMTGKIDEMISLDDMDSVKRMFYLIKNDDVENYIKYGYPSLTYFDDFDGKDSAIASIIENKSAKIFNACVQNGIKRKSSPYRQFTLVGSMYKHIDTLVKMACDSDCLEFLEAIDFLSFAVGDKTQQLKSNASIIDASFRHTCDPKTAYLVSPDVFEYIFNSPTVSDRIVEYVSTYRAFQSNSIKYAASVYYYNLSDIYGDAFYFLEQNIIEQLYKTRRFELLNNYIQQTSLDAAKALEFLNKPIAENYKLQNGYLLSDSPNYGIRIIGKLITIDKEIIELAISNLDDRWANIFIDYNRIITERLNADNLNFKLRFACEKIFAPNTQELNALFDEAKRQKRIRKIKENSSITDKQRREQLFEEDALSISDAINADDYDLFAKFPEEKTNAVTLLDIANADCNDIRFYIHALNVDDSSQNLNTALKSVLEKHFDRYDILDALLSAGATIDDNIAITNILKQNVALRLSDKETPTANIEVDNNASKDALIKSLKEGKSEYVVVNLTMVLECKLKNKIVEQDMDLIDMIDKAHNMGIINAFECKLLHNLRKARNGILHQSGRFYYTEPIIKTWIEIVYSL